MRVVTALAPVLALALACASCGNPLDNPFGAALRSKPAERVAGTGAAGGAEVAVVVKVEKVSGGGGRGELRDQWRVVHLLTLPGRPPLEILGTSPELGSEELVRLADLRYRIETAPDGRAVAFSSDDGATWGMARFATEHALFCAHLQLPREALWAGAPDERTLATAVLGTGKHDFREVQAALAFLAKRADDSGLHGEVLAEAATRELAPVDVATWRLFDFFPLLRSAVRLHPGARERYVQALARADGKHSVSALNAAALLGGADDAESQDALAAALGRALGIEDPSMYRDHFRANLAESLARVTDAMGSGSEAARAAVASALEGDALNRAGTLWLIRAAARLDRAALETFAARECEQTAHPDWPESTEEFADRVENPQAGQAFPTCCWAKSALGK